jgi:hypothetical protein
MDDYDDMSDLDRRNRPAFKLIALGVVFGLLPLFGLYLIWQWLT